MTSATPVCVTFSREGLEALYVALLEEGCPVELDVVALCCGFTEYGSISDYNYANQTGYSTWSSMEYDTGSFVIRFGESAIVQCGQP